MLADRRRSPGPLLIAVGAVWGVFWGAWAGLLPAVKDQIGATTGDLGLALVAVPVGAIPAMALTGRFARGRERQALAAVTVAFAAAVAPLAAVSSPVALGGVLAVVGMASGALDVCLNMTTARAERDTGRRLFQPVHAAFPVAVVVAAPLAGIARQLGADLPVILLTVAAVVASVGVLTPRLPLDPTAPTAPTNGPKSRLGPGWWLGFGVGALGACMLIVENAIEQWSALLLEDFRHAPPVVASSGPAVYYLALTGGRLLAQAMPRLGTRAILAIGAVGGGLGIVSAALLPTAALTLTCIVITGLAFGPLMPALFSHIAGYDSDGSVVAVATTTSYSGFLVSPLMVATLTGFTALPGAVACLGVLALPLLGAAVGGRFSPRPNAARAESGSSTTASSVG